MQLVSSTCQKCCVISLGFMHKIPMSSSTQQKRKVIWKKFESSLETRPSYSRQFLNNTSLSKPLSFLPTHPLIIEGSHLCQSYICRSGFKLQKLCSNVTASVGTVLASICEKKSPTNIQNFQLVTQCREEKKSRIGTSNQVYLYRT